jgi:hypothetical protein
MVAVHLAEISHVLSGISLPFDIVASAYLATRTLAVLTALFGPEKLSRRAREVLRLLARDRNSRGQ